jgi:hypothetical protein
MKPPKHKMPRLPGPRHLARARLSMVVRLLEFEADDLSEDPEKDRWWLAREARALEVGARR